MAKDKLTTIEVQMAIVSTTTANIDKKVDQIAEKLEKEYVTEIEFDPIKKIVYGLVGLILVAVFGALIALVVIPR